MEMNTWARALALTTACLALAACEERELLPDSHPTFTTYNQLQSFICAFTLDRSGLGLDLPELPDPEHRVLAGYVTTFIPGQPPFACDRLNQWMHRGAFDFNVAELRGTVPEPLRSAILEIMEFTPVNRGIQIIRAEPWGLDFNQGFLSSDRVHTTCRFRLAIPTERWVDAPPSRRGTIPLRSLRGSRGQLRAPLSDTLFFEVGEEVRDWFYGTSPETGFVIVPDDPSFNAKASNSCLGFFTVRLRAFFGTD